MTTDIFKITAAEFKRRINSYNDLNGFQYGEGMPYTEDDIIELLNEKEDTVMCNLAEKYRLLCRTLEHHGEVVVKYATDGQTTCSLGMTPIVDGTLKVYVNYPQDIPFISHERENYKLPDSGFEYDAEENVLTLTAPLSVGSRVYATYRHEGAYRLRMLKRLAIDLAIVQIARDLHMDTENYEVYKDIEMNVYSTFKRMREKGDGRVAIDALDNLNLVKPTRSANHSFGYI